MPGRRWTCLLTAAGQPAWVGYSYYFCFTTITFIYLLTCFDDDDDDNDYYYYYFRYIHYTSAKNNNLKST